MQDKRISVIDALAHPYLDEGRLRYHSCMCKCCFTTTSGLRQYTNDFEPAAAQPFDDLWERKLTSTQQVKGTWLQLEFCTARKQFCVQLVCCVVKKTTTHFVKYGIIGHSFRSFFDEIESFVSFHFVPLQNDFLTQNWNGTFETQKCPEIWAILLVLGRYFEAIIQS